MRKFSTAIIKESFSPISSFLDYLVCDDISTKSFLIPSMFQIQTSFPILSSFCIEIKIRDESQGNKFNGARFKHFALVNIYW